MTFRRKNTTAPTSKNSRRSRSLRHSTTSKPAARACCASTSWSSAVAGLKGSEEVLRDLDVRPVANVLSEVDAARFEHSGNLGPVHGGRDDGSTRDRRQRLRRAGAARPHRRRQAHRAAGEERSLVRRSGAILRWRPLSAGSSRPRLPRVPRHRRSGCRARSSLRRGAYEADAGTPTTDALPWRGHRASRSPSLRPTPPPRPLRASRTSVPSLYSPTLNAMPEQVPGTHAQCLIERDDLATRRTAVMERGHSLATAICRSPRTCRNRNRRPCLRYCHMRDCAS